MGKKEEAVKTLSDARAKYPKDADLLRAEVNVYLTDQKYDQALGLLKDLTKNSSKRFNCLTCQHFLIEKQGNRSTKVKSWSTLQSERWP